MAIRKIVKKPVGTVISVINMKGGVGKTTLTMNLGEIFSRKEKEKVLIIDMDPQFNSTQGLLTYCGKVNKIANVNSLYTDFSGEIIGERNEIKITDIFQKIFTSKRNVMSFFENPSIVDETKSIIIKITDNLHLIPGDLELSTKMNGDTSKIISGVKNYIENNNIRDNYKYIFIDCPPTWNVLTKSSLLASDFYLIPAKIDYFSIYGIPLLEKQIREDLVNDRLFKCDVKPLGIVFTMTDSSVIERVEKDKMKKELGGLYFFKVELPYMATIYKNRSLLAEVEPRAKRYYTRMFNLMDQLSSEVKSKVNEGKR